MMLKPIERMLGAECSHFSIYNILQYKGADILPGYFKQSGLYYIKEGLGTIGFLRSRFLTVQEELNMVHGVELIELKASKEKIFLNNLKELLNIGEPVIISVDTYHLKSSIFYKERHVKHAIIISGYKNNNFYMIDDSYQYSGELDEIELINASKIIENDEIEFRYAYLNLENIRKHEDLGEHYNIINLNIKYTDGLLSSQELKKLADYNNVDIDNLSVGINSVKEFLKKFQEDISIIVNNNSDFFYKLYQSFMEVSVGRYRYSEFLRELSIHGVGTIYLEEALKEISQDWQVVANMSLKCMIKKDFEVLNRIQNKLEKIIIKEEKFSEKIMMFLDNK